MNKIKEFLNFTFNITKDIHIDVKTILFVILVFFLTGLLLKLTKKLLDRKLEEQDKGKFKSIYSFAKYFVYVLVLVIALESSGIKVGVLLAGSAALLVGIGLGLQTLFQDIISGIFILIDKSLHVNDIIELEGKVGKVEEIKLRTTRAVTIDDKVLIIPNHKFLTNSLFNWTQNGVITTETIDISIAYGSDVEKVKQLLIETAKEHPKILKNKTPDVLFMDFADSSLLFRLRFTINDSYAHIQIKSDLRFAIDKKFREHNITIPFPQREVHVFERKEDVE